MPTPAPFNAPLRRQIRLVVAVSLALTLFWGGLSALGLLARPAWFVYHAFFELRGPNPAPADIAIVAIDEASLEDLNVWPPPRTIFAELIDGLFAAGASDVALDVTFPQPQSPATDAALARALARHLDHVVLAADLQPREDEHSLGETLVLPYAPFRRAAAFGFVNLSFDQDVAIHRFAPFVASEALGGKTFESFDLAIARRFAPKASLPWLSGGTRDVLINYAGPPGHFHTVGLYQTLEAMHDHDPRVLGLFKHALVLVGATSLRMQDHYATPFSALALGGQSASYMPGVEIHANILDTMLHTGPIREVPRAIQWLLLLLTGLLGGSLFARLKPWWGVLALASSLAVLLGLGLGLFSLARWWLPGLVPMAGLLATLFTASVAIHFAGAERTRRFYRRTFERYVAPEIVEELLRDPSLAPSLGGERREVSVLFSDIRSFTTISERLSPEEVVEFLNAYLTAMAAVIHAQKGCIDKYIGDAILALWGNLRPIAPEEAAKRAVRAALAMKAQVAALQDEWQARGYPHIEIGVGVNTGQAIVGNIGSPEKLEFGVIGDSINVASRLEGLTKDYGGAVLISGRTRELIGEGFDCTYLDLVKVKGREQPVPIYRVNGEVDQARSA